MTGYRKQFDALAVGDFFQVSFIGSSLADDYFVKLGQYTFRRTYDHVMFIINGGVLQWDAVELTKLNSEDTIPHGVGYIDTAEADARRGAEFLRASELTGMSIDEVAGADHALDNLGY